MNMNTLADEAFSLFNISLTPQQQSMFQVYEQELISWNKQYNLTAINSPEKIRRKHFLDSLSAVLALRGSTINRIIDVGTGAGFPGIPLKIIFPNIQLTLLESVGKKVTFCEHITRLLNLDNVEIIKGRAETLGKSSAYREQFDWAIGRAVAFLPVLVEYLLPFVRLGGGALAMKGNSGPIEAHTAENAMRILGGKLRQLIQVSLPGVTEERFLVVIDKIASTPEKYPRRTGLPKKRPL